MFVNSVNVYLQDDIITIKGENAPKFVIWLVLCFESFLEHLTCCMHDPVYVCLLNKMSYFIA